MPPTASTSSSVHGEASSSARRSGASSSPDAISKGAFLEKGLFLGKLCQRAPRWARAHGVPPPGKPDHFFLSMRNKELAMFGPFRLIIRSSPSVALGSLAARTLPSRNPWPSKGVAFTTRCRSRTRPRRTWTSGASDARSRREGAPRPRSTPPASLSLFHRTPSRTRRACSTGAASARARM